MADEMTGMERLRMAAKQNSLENCQICKAANVMYDCDCNEHCEEERGRALTDIADQIEREHTNALNAKSETICRQNAEIDQLRIDLAAKRELPAEAREVVKRLREVGDSASSIDRLGRTMDALGIDCSSVTVSINALRDRLIELIECGAQGVDVAEPNPYAMIADRMKLSEAQVRACLDWYGTSVALMDEGIAREAEREAAADWVEQREGLEALSTRYQAYMDIAWYVLTSLGCYEPGIGYLDAQDVIKAELDKRLMPPGMEWLRYDDGEKVLPSDEGVIGIEYSRTGNTILVTTSARPTRA